MIIIDVAFWSQSRSYADYSSVMTQDYQDQDGDEINGGRLAKPRDFPW